MTGHSEFANVASMIDLIESMPRLESLAMGARVDLSRLLQLEFANLHSIRFRVNRIKLGCDASPTSCPGFVNSVFRAS